MTSLVYRLPWPRGITVNTMYVKTARGLKLSPAAVAWRADAIITIRQQIIDERGILELPERVRFVVDYWPPKDWRKHDPSNLLKLTEDAVFDAFVTDDERIWWTESRRHEADGTPRLVVTIDSFALGLRVDDATGAGRGPRE